MGPRINTYILVSPKKWHDKLFKSLKKNVKGKWIRITEKENFTFEKLIQIQPKYIFISHWSHKIPAEIYNNFNCVLFHMTDLPFGRGGSPLQNLIVRGLKETKLTAIQVSEGIDAGHVYLKKKLSLKGTALEIFERAVPLIEKMIVGIIKNDIQPISQIGDPVNFKRRKPEESNIEKIDDVEKLFDYIRMLDCEGYPHAFIETDHFKFEFTKAKLKKNHSIQANVRIISK